MCNVGDIIYKAILSIEGETCDKYYFGQSTDFKKRWSNHNMSFRNRNVEQHCALKDFIWKLKDQRKNFTIKWELHRKSKVYKPGDPMCYLCMDEKLAIKDCFEDKNNINKDHMVMRRCDHKHEYRITNIEM